MMVGRAAQAVGMRGTHHREPFLGVELVRADALRARRRRGSLPPFPAGCADRPRGQSREEFADRETERRGAVADFERRERMHVDARRGRATALRTISR
jgi:hypothetical protein